MYAYIGAFEGTSSADWRRKRGGGERGREGGRHRGGSRARRNADCNLEENLSSCKQSRKAALQRHQLRLIAATRPAASPHLSPCMETGSTGFFFLFFLLLFVLVLTSGSYTRRLPEPKLAVSYDPSLLNEKRLIKCAGGWCRPAVPSPRNSGRYCCRCR